MDVTLQSSGTLKKPLLDSTMEDEWKEQDAQLFYPNNAPKIFLETITARTALIIIVLTYSAFIVGFAIDLYLTYQSFNADDFQISPNECYNSESVCGHSSGNVWNASITHLNNVISVKCWFSKIICLWCGDKFDSNERYTTNGGIWQRVIESSSETVSIDLESDIQPNDQGEGLQVTLITSTFQNQESIPTNGKVKSYFIEVQYTDAPEGLFIASDENEGNILYLFDVVSRPQMAALNALVVVLMALTFAVGLWYCRMLRRHQKLMLSEHKWLLVYFLLLLLFQNPVYSVIVWYTRPPTPVAAFSSYFVGYIAQTGLFVLWLVFADSLQRRTSDRARFYGWKIAVGVVLFVVSLALLSYHFPGLNPDKENRRSAVQAVIDWSRQLKLDFISLTVAYIGLIWCWALAWLFLLYRTGAQLNKLPYMSTRYIQLSYRFFSLQATLVTIYYLLQFGVVIYFFSDSGTQRNGDSLTNLTGHINTLLRLQTQLFGKILFLTVYAFILAFLLLPASLWEQSDIVATTFAAVYVVSEAEHAAAVRKRRRALNKLKRTVDRLVLLQRMADPKVDVFCLDTAIAMRSLAFEAYYDPLAMRTASGSSGGQRSMNLEHVGHEMLATHYNREHEVFCFLSRDRATGRYALCFRGTASKKQMEDNIHTRLVAVDLRALDNAAIDEQDGLLLRVSSRRDGGSDHGSLSDDGDMEAGRSPRNVHGEKLGIDLGGEDEAKTAADDAAEGSKMADFPADRTAQSVGARVRQAAGNVREHVEVAVDTTKLRVGAAVTATKLQVRRAVGAAQAGMSNAVVATKGAVAKAAGSTPGLRRFVVPSVHSGYWEAYLQVRAFIHLALRTHLAERPGDIVCTGHSLGGALATFAALDLSLHTIPRVRAWLTGHHHHRHRRRSHSDSERQEPCSPMSTGSVEEKEPVEGLHSIQQRRLSVFMYNFGSSRLGNRAFVSYYNQVVQRSYRVVVDGDFATGLPPSYWHVGTEVLIDGAGAGCIIVDPSFVERWLRTHMKSSVAAHSLHAYRRGLAGVRMAAEFMKQRHPSTEHKANETEGEAGEFDALGLALSFYQYVQSLSAAVLSTDRGDREQHGDACAPVEQTPVGYVAPAMLPPVEVVRTTPQCAEEGKER